MVALTSPVEMDLSAENPMRLKPSAFRQIVSRK